MAGRPGRGEIVVIVSGKGGVGKTNLALNLSLDLARRRKRTILLDADFGLANADILLDLSPLADFSDLLDFTRPVADLLVAGPYGLRLLGGVSGPGRDGRPFELGPEACARALARLAAECDVLVVDCGAGVTPPIAAFARAADLLVVTTTPEPTALADAYATLKLLAAQGFTGRTGVVVNMVRSRGEAARVAARLAAASRQFLGLALEELGFIAGDRHVPLAVRQRVPVLVRYPRCAASLCVGELSRRIVPARPRSAGGPGVWARVASLFL